MIPGSVNNKIQSHFNSEIKSENRVYGGDINQTSVAELASGQKLFVKWNASAPKDMFPSEAKGLKLLASAQTNLVIPHALLAYRDFLVMAFIPKENGQSSSSYDFGVELAKLHQHTDSHFGLDHDNYIGRLPQSNNKHANWPDFFTLERIEPQVKMGIESGKLSRKLFRDVENLYKKLGAIFPNEKPALIHGDLWNGNYLFTANGKTSIYDPAVYYAHREMEIAMTKLFGGFSSDFYRGYNDQFPLDRGWENRVILCNLYPVLVHANMFGGSYSRQAEGIIRHYS